jgi:DNA-binding SARP family transcriptional activator
VIESDLENISGIQVSLADVEGLRLSINICCKADLSFFACKDNVRYETDDDEEYQQLVFLLEGGAAV